MAGVDLRTIQELGGWKSLSMVMRYSHLSLGHKRGTVEALVANSPARFTTVAPAAHCAEPSNLRLVN